MTAKLLASSKTSVTDEDGTIWEKDGRCTGCLLQNDSSTDNIYFDWGKAATVANSVKLIPGAILALGGPYTCPADSLHVIAESGKTPDLRWQRWGS